MATDLVCAIRSIEQQCQTLRWRLDNFKDAKSIRHLKSDIGTLVGGACLVARLHGELEVLTALMSAAQGDEDAADDSKPCFPEVEGFPKPPSSENVPNQADVLVLPESQIAPVTESGLAENSPAAMTYNVNQLLGDTEIVDAQRGGGEYPTFEAAKAAAIDYPEDVMELCEVTIDELREGRTVEQHFGNEAPTDNLTDGGGNVQFVCPAAYPPNPEIQSNPPPWFAGKSVKLRFPIPRRPKNAELMWVAVTSIRGEELVGTLTNEPLFADQTCGDEIVFDREDVLVVYEGGLAARQS